MFFSGRKKYNGKVAALLPAFGFTLEEAGAMKTLNVLDIAWDKKYTEYEGALYVACLFLAGLIKEGDTRKQVELLKKLDFLINDWVNKGLVDKKLATGFLNKISEWTISAHNLKVEPDNATGTEFEFLPNMPDVTKVDPIKSYTLDKYLLVLVKDIPCIAEQTSGKKLPLQFLYAMVVVDTLTNNPNMFITLETENMKSVFICVIDSSGERSNLGDGSSFTKMDNFEEAAIRLICNRLNLDRKNIIKR